MKAFFIKGIILFYFFNGSCLAQDIRQSYKERLKQIDYLGQYYPAHRPPLGGVWRKHGMWAGMGIQTEWQLKSGRYQFPIWHRVNETLTTFPFQVAKQLEAHQSCESNQYVQKLFNVISDKKLPEDLKFDVLHVCDIWKQFLSVAKKDYGLFDAEIFNDKRSEQQKILWQAHSEGIILALELYGDEMKANSPGPLEWNYWGNWIAIVFYLEKINFSTLEAEVLPVAKLLNPGCSPLDDKFCLKQIMTSSLKKSYALQLSGLDVTLDDLIAKKEFSGTELLVDDMFRMLIH